MSITASGALVGQARAPHAADPVSVSQASLRGVPGVTAFVNVGVVPMDTERVLIGQTVVVQGGRITALGPTRRVRIPAGAVRIDGHGQYLIPGLADMHAHLVIGPGGEPQGLTNDDSATFLDFAIPAGAAWLAEGVTTVRLLDYGWPALSTREMQLKAHWGTGDLLWPRIYNAGPWGPLRYLNVDWDPDTSPLERMSPDPPALRLDSIAHYVAAYKAAGYDLIKVHEEVAVVVDSLLAVAHRVGIPLVGHLPKGFPIERAITEGYSCIEHPIDEYESATMDWAHPDTARLRALARALQKGGVWNTPTLAHYEGAVLHHSHGSLAVQARRRVIIKTLQEAGVGLLLGTDNPAGTGVHEELQSLVGAGLTPYQALATGTRNVAQYLGTLHESGTVVVGKWADLVLLRGNPLADIHNTTAISGVMLGGRWLPRKASKQ